MSEIDTSTNSTGLQTRVILTVATLPAASTMAGHRRYVSDSDIGCETGFGKVVVGSGTFQVCVRSDGTSWRVSI